MEAPLRSREHVPHPIRPYEPLIINAAITGMVPTRARVPHVPVTPEQIVESAIPCVEAGASIVHLHARDADGRPTWRRGRLREFIPRSAGGAPRTSICVATSGRNEAEVENRADVLDLEGDASPTWRASRWVAELPHLGQRQRA